MKVVYTENPKKILVTLDRVDIAKLIALGASLNLDSQINRQCREIDRFMATGLTENLLEIEVVK